MYSYVDDLTMTQFWGQHAEQNCGTTVPQWKHFKGYISKHDTSKLIFYISIYNIVYIYLYDIWFDHLSAPVSCSQIIDKNFHKFGRSLFDFSGFFCGFSGDIIQRVPQKCVSTAVKYSNFTAMGKILAI